MTLASLAKAPVFFTAVVDSLKAHLVEGTILEAPRGSGGFGYDPLFYCPEIGQTFAEAGVGPKGHISHRARAMAALAPRLRAYLTRRDAP